MEETPLFKIVPDESELAKQDRVLRFHPASSDGLDTLSTEQVGQFNRDGYLRPFPLFDAAEVADTRDYFDRLLEGHLAAGGDPYSISSAHLTYGRVYDLLTDQRIVRVACDLLGENVIGWGSHFFCKMPGDGQLVAWHQDASYWPLNPSRAVTIWLAIDDADTQNACLRFIAGSHHHGHLTYRPSDPNEHNVLNQTISDPERFGTVVEDELLAGTYSVHSDLLLHGSEANNSPRRRCGLTLRYCAAEVRADLEWNAKGVWVSGCDASGHWRNNPRPTQE